MSRYTVSQARAKLAELLDRAETGQPVVIDRRGVRFRLVVAPAKKRRAPEPILELIDPAVERGDWTWAWGEKGLRFVSRGKARPSRPGSSRRPS